MIRHAGIMILLATIFVGGNIFLVAIIFGASQNVKLFISISGAVLFVIGYLLYTFGPVTIDDSVPRFRTERVWVTSRELVIGDAYFELPGTVITGIPNGWCDIAYETVDGVIVGFEIHFPDESVESEHEERESFTIDGGVAMIADPRGVQSDSDVHRAECKRRFESELSQSLWQSKYKGDYSLVLEDAGSKPWALAIAPAPGDGSYELKIRRRGDKTISISCEFV